MRKRTYNEALVDALLKKLESEEFLEEWEARQRLPHPDEARGVPVVGRGVSGAIPGSHPARDADLSPYGRREAIMQELQRMAGYDRDGDPLPRKRSRREIAEIVRTTRRNLDEVVEFGDEWVNLMLTYTGRHSDPKAPKGHPDLPPDWNEVLKNALLWEWLGKTLDLMTPTQLRPIRDGLIEEAIQQHPELSNRQLAALLDNEVSHDTINRIRKRLERTQMNAAVTEIKEHVDQRLDRIERLESMRAETMDHVRQTLEELAARYPADPRIQSVVEGFHTD